jgi:hypothetical protein
VSAHTKKILDNLNYLRDKRARKMNDIFYNPKPYWVYVDEEGYYLYLKLEGDQIVMLRFSNKESSIINKLIELERKEIARYEYLLSQSTIHGKIKSFMRSII